MYSISPPYRAIIFSCDFLKLLPVGHFRGIWLSCIIAITNCSDDTEFPEKKPLWIFASGRVRSLAANSTFQFSMVVYDLVAYFVYFLTSYHPNLQDLFLDNPCHDYIFCFVMTTFKMCKSKYCSSLIDLVPLWASCVLFWKQSTEFKPE